MAYATSTKDYANLDAARITNDIMMGDPIMELWPSEVPFQTFLRKTRHEPTGDPNPKKLVHKSGWADRRFFAAGAGTWSASANGATASNVAVELSVGGSNNVGFLIAGLMLRIKTSGGDTTAIISNVDSQQQVDLVSISSSPNAIADGDEIQVISTAFARGADKATATYDTTTTQATWTQIFKTVVDVTGTLAATETFGMSEYERLMDDKAKEHAVDIERALVLQTYAASGTTVGSSTVYSTYGIVPFIEDNSSTSNIFTPTYASYSFDDFIDDQEGWFTKGGNQSTSEKLALCGSSVLGFFSKIGAGKLWGDAHVNFSAGENAWGIHITTVKAPFGDLHLVHEPVLRGDSSNSFYKDYMVGVDLMNVSYRPLSGNGINRDTHWVKDLQTTYDKLIHQMLTEAALHPTLEETHALFKFS